MCFQGVTRNKAGAQLGQLTFGFVLELREEVLRNHHLQDRIAQKFQSLVVKMPLLGFMTYAWMGQGFGEQQWIAKFVADPFFQ